MPRPQAAKSGALHRGARVDKTSDAVRRTTLATFLGGIIVMFLIVAGAFVYFTASDEPGGSGNPTDPTAVGTSGERMPREGTPGGFDTDPSFGSTRDELEYRGGATERVEHAVGVARVVVDDRLLLDGDGGVDAFARIVAITSPSMICMW